MSTSARGNSANETVIALKPNRREFMYYVGGAGLALLLGQTCAGLSWFTNPGIRYGVESGVFLLEPDILPQMGDDPAAFPDGKCWLVHLETGLLAMSGVCPFDGILIRWVPLNRRYECPHCGGKQQIDGIYIEGPAKRSLDRFPIEVTDRNGRYFTSSDGSPISIDNAKSIVVDTRTRILVPKSI